jgi:selenocysteine lyase/cysteine desulfurase
MPGILNPWQQFRQQMPIARRLAYLDHAATSPLSGSASDALQAWSRQAAEWGDTVWPEWEKRANQVRQTAAGLIGAAAEEVALVPNTTAGINLVAEGFPWRQGDNVVTLANEFPSNQYPWLNLADRGVEARRVPVEDGRVDLERIADACDARTRIISVSWIGYATGWRMDLDALVALAHARGALVFLDAIQGLGVFPIHVQRLGLDFLAADGHKWLLGPEGAGIFYVRREHLTRLRPLSVGWNSVVGAHDFGRIDLDLRPDAARYEGGSRNMAGLAA